MIDVTLPLERLRGYIEAEGFKGYDPYDALNSPALKALSLGLKWPRIAFIQFMKRSPINLRPILLVPKGYNPKGIGLFLWGYAKLYRATKDKALLGTIDHLTGLLETLRSRGYSGNAWGYNFDWQSRAFYVPSGTPTIVNSAFIGHALLDAYRYTGNARALELALPIKQFILRDLRRLDSDGKDFCFSYTPIDNSAVHNASLLGASLLIRLHEIEPDEEAREAAMSALSYSMRRQHDDGSWYYAETSFQGWIDSFHTGFNLQCLKYFLDGGHAPEYREAFERGVRFYADRFFLDDGTPKYYHDRVEPIDIHSPAQAVVFFSGMGPGYEELTDKALGWMLENMQAPEGYFYFQINKGFVTKIPYMRWGQSWAFHALTEYYMNSTVRNG